MVCQSPRTRSGNCQHSLMWKIICQKMYKRCQKLIKSIVQWRQYINLNFNNRELSCQLINYSEWYAYLKSM